MRGLCLGDVWCGAGFGVLIVLPLDCVVPGGLI